MFEHVVMLAGLGGAVVPLVLHLLSRARYRSVDWGAMMFLTGSGPSPGESASRLKEWTLLALRMGAIALLAVALARPVAGKFEPPPSVTAAIVIDRSASMALGENGVARMDAARAAVLRILATLGKGDQAVLITTGDGQRRTVASLRAT